MCSFEMLKSGLIGKTSEMGQMTIQGYSNITRAITILP